MSTHVCARCPKVLGNSCCEVKEHERLATLTWADVERVNEATGLSAHAFTEWEWLDAAQTQAWLDVHPAYVGYLGPAPRRLTLKVLNGACALLQPDSGCTLSEAARPTACRLYPFDVSEGLLQVERFGDLGEARRSVETGGGHACLAVEEAQSERELEEKLAVTAPQLRALAARLRTEIAEHAKRERRDRAKSTSRDRER